MPTANETYFDSQLRHAVGVRRYGAGQVKAILRAMEALDAETVARLRRRLGRTGRRGLDSKILAALLEDVRVLRDEGIRAAGAELRAEMKRFARAEVEFEGRMVRAAIPLEISLAAVDTEALAAVIASKPFQGAILRDWVSGLSRADKDRLERTIKQGVAEGRGVDDIVRSVVGTRRAGYADGILAVSRRQAETIVRTTVNHVSNGARELFYEENSSIIRALRWESTLDSRTSPICQARDGALAPVGGKPLPRGATKLDPPDARPPAHPNCRSVMIAVLDGDAEIFEGLDRQSEVGPVPQETTYGEWLAKQPAAFQDEVLGRAKGALFRRGGLTVDRFVDRRGNELTLDQLRRADPVAFERAGV